MSAPRHALMALLVAAFAVAMLIASAYALREAPGRVRQVERRHQEWSALREQAARMAADQAALASATREGGAPPLAEWFRERHSSWAVELKDADVERINNEWALRRIQVTIPRAALADVGDAIEQLARGPAPWRAVELNLSALDAEPGYARVVLLLEGLARAPATTP